MKRSPVRLLVPIIVLSGWAAVLMAQQATPPATSSSPALQRRDNGVATLRTSARLVLLDVVVTDSKGKPVKGLRQADFNLLEDGNPQTLSSFQEHQALTAAEAAKLDSSAKLPPNRFSNLKPVVNENAATIFLLDALDTPIQAQMYLREQMIDYMKNVPAGTKVAIFQLDTQLRMIQGFTSDPEVLRQVVNSKRNQPELSPLLGGPNAPAYARERMRQDILIQAMQGLARYLAPLPGRKNLIWFTGAVPVPVYGPGFNVPFPDITSFIDDFSKTTDVLTLSRIAVYPVDARGLQTGPVAGRGGFRAIDRFENRQFYQHGDLDDIAEATGGKAFYNTNGVKEAIAEVVDTGSNYYTLSYSPSNKVWDGNYRKLQVKLADQGFHMEYRRGYYARNDEFIQSQHIAQIQSNRRVLPMPGVNGQSSPVLNTAMHMGAVAPRDVLFLVDVTPAAEVAKAKGDEPLAKDNYLDKKYRKQPYRDYQLHISVDPNTVRLMPTPDLSYHGRLDFVIVVYDDTGQPVNSKIAHSVLDLDNATYQQLMRSGLGTVQSIAIPVKGNFFLRLGVYDVSADKAGALEIPVDQIKLGLPQDQAAKP